MNMKKALLGFSCFFLLFSCSVSDSSHCGCTVRPDYHVFLYTLIVDSNGNSFMIKEVRLEDKTLCFIGRYVFHNLDSNVFLLSGDGYPDIEDYFLDFAYFFDLDATNSRNETALTDRYLTLSGEWTLCFAVDDFFLTEMENVYLDGSDEEKQLHAYFKINDLRGHTTFRIPFSKIVVA